MNCIKDKIREPDLKHMHTGAVALSVVEEVIRLFYK